jgi:two-component system chemotaxis response regulator CheB
VIGASTGGPPVLEAILKELPNPFPTPIAVVQHMTAGFNREFARWLSEVTGRRAVMVEEPVFMEPGVVYLATDDRHLVLTSRFELAPSDSNERRFQRPSVDVLFESAARHFGSQVAAVLLTGMGSDGIEGMAALKACGAFTLAQKPESCVVDSMPRGAIDREIVDVVADPAGIAAALTEHSREAPTGLCQPGRR